VRFRISTTIAMMGLSGLAVSQTSIAQVASGAIMGQLIDENGAVVTGLETLIYLTNRETHVEYSAAVSRDGDYELTGLPAGSYDLNFPIACCMYRTYAQENLVIAAGETVQMDLNLKWGINLGTIGDDPGMLSNDMRSRAGDVSGPAPRMPDGTPDLSGIWYNVPIDGPRPQPSLQPWAAEIQQQLLDLGVDQNAGAYCLPQSAVPTTLIFPYKFIQTPDVIVQLTEFVTPGFRQIFMDGRDHPELWNPAWMGHSTGTWDGDTLVVETVGFNEITPGFGIHTEKLRVVERYTRTSFGSLAIEITAEDPDAYTEPFTAHFEAGIATADQEILEFVCAENNDRPLNIGGVGWRGRP